MKAIRIIVLIFIMMACNKENDNYRSVGTVTGIDGTMCGCCGGWIINIDSGRYLIDSMPKNSGLDLSTESFPVTVKLDWQLVDNQLLDQRNDKRIIAVLQKDKKLIKIDL